MAVTKGWFSVYRRMIASNIWIKSTPKQKTILITIMSMMNHTERSFEFSGKPILIKKNQLVTSLQEIADYSGKGITIENVRSALKRFGKLQFITKESTNQGTLLTICEYETYEQKMLSSHKLVPLQNTNKTPTKHNQSTTNKNYNNIRSKEEEEASPEKFIINFLMKTYIESESNRLKLFNNTNFSTDISNLKRIITKYAYHLVAKNGELKDTIRVKAGFSYWLMNEKIDKQNSTQSQKINLGKFIK